MKSRLLGAVCACSFLLPATANAVLFDFQDWINTNGEQGFTNLSPFAMTESGLTLEATAFEEPGMVNSHVYMDDVFNGIIGGMGVCTTLTTGNQCSPSSDDNVSIDGSAEEILTWDFSQNITELTLELGDSEHFDFNNGAFEYSLNDGLNWLTATMNGSPMVTLLFAGGTGQIDFRSAGNDKTDYFYIRNADATVVPVPAAVWLFGSGLLGLVGMARRKKA